MKYEMKKSECNILKDLRSLSEKLLNISNDHPYADIASRNNLMILVQSSAHRLNSDQDNDNPDGKVERYPNKTTSQ